MLRDFVDIIWMKPCLSVAILPFFKAKAEIIQKGSVCENTFFAVPINSEVMRREVQHLLELHVPLPDLRFLVLLFAQFEYEGENPDGTLRGRFKVSNIRPSFWSRLQYFNLDQRWAAAINEAPAGR